MSKYSNSFVMKYLLKLPIVPLWPKDKIAKYTHLKYVEQLDKAKTLNKLEGANPLLEQYFIYDHMHYISKPLFFISALYSIRLMLSKRLTLPKRIIYPMLILVPTGMMTSALFSLKEMIHMTYIKRNLLKTEDQKEIDDYLRFSYYYSNI